MTHYNIFLITTLLSFSLAFISNAVWHRGNVGQSHVILCLFRSLTTSLVDCMSQPLSPSLSNFSVVSKEPFLPASSWFRLVAIDFTCWLLARGGRGGTQKYYSINYCSVLSPRVIVYSRSCHQKLRSFSAILINLHCILNLCLILT